MVVPKNAGEKMNRDHVRGAVWTTTIIGCIIGIIIIDNTEIWWIRGIIGLVVFWAIPFIPWYVSPLIEDLLVKEEPK